MHYSLTRATSWNLLSFLYLILASLLTTPALIRALGVTSFAHYLLAIGLTTLLSSIDLGIPRALIRELSPKDKKGSVLATATWLTLICAAGLSLIALISSHLLRLPTSFFLPIMLLTILGSLLSLYQSVPESRGSFGWVGLRALLVGTTNTFGAVLLAQAGFGLGSILYALIIASVITLLLFLIYTHRLFGQIPVLPYDAGHAQSLLTFGLPNQGGKIVGQLQAQYAKFLFVGSPLALTGYGVASNLVAKLVGGVTQLASAFYPRATQSVGEARLRKLYYRLQACMLFLGILGVWLYAQFGYGLLSWWLAEQKLVALMHPLLVLSSYSAALLMLTPLASAIMDSHGAPGTTSLFGLSAFLIELVLALILLPTYGAQAPVIGQLIALIILVPIFLYATEKKFRKS